MVQHNRGDGINNDYTGGSTGRGGPPRRLVVDRDEDHDESEAKQMSAQEDNGTSFFLQHRLEEHCRGEVHHQQRRQQQNRGREQQYSFSYDDDGPATMAPTPTGEGARQLESFTHVSNFFQQEQHKPEATSGDERLLLGTTTTSTSNLGNNAFFFGPQQQQQQQQHQDQLHDMWQQLAQQQMQQQPPTEVSLSRTVPLHPHHESASSAPAAAAAAAAAPPARGRGRPMSFVGAGTNINDGAMTQGAPPPQQHQDENMMITRRMLVEHQQDAGGSRSSGGIFSGDHFGSSIPASLQQLLLLLDPESIMPRPIGGHGVLPSFSSSTASLNQQFPCHQERPHYQQPTRPDDLTTDGRQERQQEVEEGRQEGEQHDRSIIVGRRPVLRNNNDEDASRGGAHTLTHDSISTSTSNAAGGDRGGLLLDAALSNPPLGGGGGAGMLVPPLLLGNPQLLAARLQQSSQISHGSTETTYRSEDERNLATMPDHAARGGFVKERTKATITPCKARGLPQDHNAQTAFFIIRESIQHGEGLLCSHTECQKRGVRFVFCKICGTPVAKINFSTRHRHRDVLEADDDNDHHLHHHHDGAAVSSTTASRGEKRSHDKDEKEQEEEEPHGGMTRKTYMSASSSPAPEMTTTNAASGSSGAHSSPRSSLPAKIAKKKKDTGGGGGESGSTRSSSDQRRQAADITNTQEGYEEIASTGRVVEEQPGCPSHQMPVQEGALEWIELLKKRPPTDDQARMRKWLSDIIRVTEPPTTTTDSTAETSVARRAESVLAEGEEQGVSDTVTSMFVGGGQQHEGGSAGSRKASTST